MRWRYIVQMNPIPQRFKYMMSSLVGFNAYNIKDILFYNNIIYYTKILYQFIFIYR